MLSPKTLGNLAHLVSKGLYKSLRIKNIVHPKYDPNTQYLFAFWHGKQFLPVIHLSSHNTPNVVLVSPI